MTVVFQIPFLPEPWRALLPKENENSLMAPICSSSIILNQNKKVKPNMWTFPQPTWSIHVEKPASIQALCSGAHQFSSSSQTNYQLPLCSLLQLKNTLRIACMSASLVHSCTLLPYKSLSPHSHKPPPRPRFGARSKTRLT